MNANLELDVGDINTAIREYITKYHGFLVEGEIKYNYGRRLEGYGPNEHNADYFDGASVPVKVEPVTK